MSHLNDGNGHAQLRILNRSGKMTPTTGSESTYDPVADAPRPYTAAIAKMRAARTGTPPPAPKLPDNEPLPYTRALLAAAAAGAGR